MKTDPRWKTGHYYDGHKVRAGKRSSRRRLKIRRARRNYRRALAIVSFELGDADLLIRYMGPIRRLHD